MTRVLGKLEALGYVRRLPHADDGRSSVVLITPKGRRVVDRAFVALHARQGQLLAPLGPDARASLAANLETMHAALAHDQQ
jgi:DNA-binding MarR family transcriptional regulator